MRSLRRLAFLVVITSPLAFAGCKQGVGDRCQVTSDCADGLMCILPAGGTRQTGGTCQPLAGFDAGIDLLPSVDLATGSDGPTSD